MLTSRRLRLAAALAFVAVTSLTSTAWATTSITSGSAHCLVTARPTRIDAMHQIWGTAVVQCDIAAVVSLEMRVVEMDGTVIDPTVEVPRTSMTVTLTANTPLVVSTSKWTCVSTEPGNEELSTRAKLSLFGIQSATDYTTPLNDSYAC